MLELVVGDITVQRVDAIVNAANSSLLGGGGVDGAIHRKGGPEILAACRGLRAGHLGKGARSVAFPLLSSGVYRWPKDDAVAQALVALRDPPPGVDLVRLVLFDRPTLELAERIRGAG